jgi:hypothetical protein
MTLDSFDRRKRPFAWSLRLISVCLLSLLYFSAAALAQTTSLRFEITVARGIVSVPPKGRLLVFINRKGEREPRFDFRDPGLSAPPALAKDVENLVPGSGNAIIDNSSISHPIKNLAALPAGEYYVQALLDTNEDSASLNAPGNLYSAPQKVTLDPKRGGTIKLELNHVVPPEQMPADTEFVVNLLC